MAKLFSLSQWVETYDNIGDDVIKEMSELYQNVQMTYDEWESKMDELCEARPEWAEDN